MSLYESMKGRVHDITHSQYTVFLLDSIFDKPIFKTSDCARQLEEQHRIHKQTTLGLLRQLKEENILIEIKKGVAEGLLRSVLQI